MNLEIKDLPEMRVASLSHRGPYDQIAPVFERLGEIAGRTGLFELKGATMIALYHDDPQHTLPNELRSDAGIVVPADTKLPAELHEHHIASGRYACTTHVGPYDTLGETWMQFMGHVLPASGHQLGGGPSLEIYRNNPRTTPKSELVTEVCVPIV